MVEVSNISSPYTEEEIENYLLAFYGGLITTYTLSQEYHEKIGSLLYRGMLDGYGGVVFEGLEGEIFKAISKNIYEFSAAKQYSQAREMSRYLGDNVSFTKFSKKAKEVFEDYTKHYLQAEYNTAVTQSQNARKWAKIQAEKEVFPLLQYKTQGDSLVRDAHAALHNVIKPVNDPFWKRNYPANGWNCRCFVEQLDEGTVTKDTPTLSDEEQPEVFKSNAGMTGMLFDKRKHPYWNISKGDSDLRDKNFNLPTP